MSVHHDGVTEVHYGRLDEMATQIGKTAEQLEAGLEAIKSKVAQVSSMWEGEAHHTYTQQQADWDREAQGIHQALRAIGHAIHAAGGDYMGGDKKAASYFL
jgi:WXG100 family type VII secretion target